MTDYSNDFFLDPGIIVKQEPEMPETTTIITTASVPIPTRRFNIFDLREFGVDIQPSISPYLDSNITSSMLTQNDNSSGSSLWTLHCDELDSDFAKSEGLIHMDDDDIFQVDKADLIQGPTLAELNANDETFLEDLNFDDLMLPEEGTFSYLDEAQAGNKMSLGIQILNNSNVQHAASPDLQIGTGYYRSSYDSVSSIPSSPYGTSSYKTLTSAFSPQSQTSSTSSLLQSHSSASLPPSGMSLQQRHSALHDLLMKRERNIASPDSGILLGQSVPSRPTHHMGSSSPGLKTHHAQSSRLSSSAPTHLGMDQIWQRREPRKHLLSTSSLAEAGSTSSLSTGGVLSPEGLDHSNEDENDSDEDSDHYEDYSSDGDSDDENDKMYKSSSSKRDRYFWQYNVQAKGPKGQRLVMKTKMEDPYVLHEVTDPVFSPTCSVRGIKHSGKARKGDGNDLTPNPRKLCNIGRELDNLGRVINNMTPVSELPFNVRPKSRKEKNKLASRACRLKKKAQHEANKIKLHGLEQEHRRLFSAILQSKKLMGMKLNEAQPENQEEITNDLDKLIKTVTKCLIAGNSTEYVNKILDKVRGATSLRGLEDL